MTVPPGPTRDTRDGRRHRVVIVGSGFGGLFAAKFLRRAPVDVVVVDRTNHHLFQPLLYQVATGILSEGAIAPATRDVLKRHRNVTVELGDVVGFDLDSRTVDVVRPGGGRLELSYDSLIVAAGVTQSYFGHDEFAEHAPGMKTLADAVRQRGRIMSAFEAAESTDEPAEMESWLTFAIVGGGPTGVELAGQIAEMAHTTFRQDFRHIDPASVRVVLYEGGPEVLSTFGDRLSGHGLRELERIGVEVRTSTRVTAIDADGVSFTSGDGDEGRLQTRTVIWAAGVEASPLGGILAEASGADRDRAGRVRVLPDCTLPGHPEVFVIGDMMSLGGLPGVAEVAMQTGIHSARTIVHRLEGRSEQVPFVYRDFGSMAAITRRRSIVSFHGINLWGFPGWVVWLFVHLTFLTGFKNRFTALVSWLVSLLGHARNERAIVVWDRDDQPGESTNRSHE